MRAKAGSSRALQAFKPFSYLDDPSVPTFAQDRPLIIFDGVCVLCSGFVRFVVSRDRNRSFYLTAAQSPLGQALFKHYGLSQSDFETNLLIANGVAYGKLDAFERIMMQLGGAWRMARLTRAIPSFARDFLYDRIAKNRYVIFGRSDQCMVPPDDWDDRYLS